MGVHELSPDDSAYKLRIEDKYKVSYSSVYRYISRDDLKMVTITVKL